MWEIVAWSWKDFVVKSYEVPEITSCPVVFHCTRLSDPSVCLVFLAFQRDSWHLCIWRDSSKREKPGKAWERSKVVSQAFFLWWHFHSWPFWQLVLPRSFIEGDEKQKRHIQFGLRWDWLSSDSLSYHLCQSLLRGKNIYYFKKLMFSGHIYIICVYLKKILYKSYFFLWSHRNRLNDYSVKNKVHRQVESSSAHTMFYRVPVYVRVFPIMCKI